MHTRETKLGPETDIPPDMLRCGDQVGEGLADEREAGKVADVVEGYLA